MIDGQDLRAIDIHISPVPRWLITKCSFAGKLSRELRHDHTATSVRGAR